MKIYIIKQRIEIVSGFELDNIHTNLYGAYENEKDAKENAQKIIEKILNRKYEITNIEAIANKNEPFDKNDIVVLYKGNHWNEWKRHIIKIISLELQ